MIKVVLPFQFKMGIQSGFTIPIKNRHIKWVLPFQLKMEIKEDGEGHFTIFLYC